jgi:aminoglycoside phosphotransferase (APT) family kinase protein
MPLETAFGKLTLIGGGYHSRVYANDRNEIVKVYKHNTGMHRLEAANMTKAGLGEWLLGTFEVAGFETLLMKRFEGAPVNAKNVVSALPALGVFLRQMHQDKLEFVDTKQIRQKLERFRISLKAFEEPLEPMFTRVQTALESNLLEVQSSFCHLDLWFENILFAPPNQVRVVDWHKAALDDPARDYALLFTGTLELLPIEEATHEILKLAQAENLELRLPAYVALSTLHDLHWFIEKNPEGFQAAYDLKVPRITWFLNAI